LEPPKQNWDWYESKCRPNHIQWLRSLTPAHSLNLCEELRRLATELTKQSPDAERLEQERWREKLLLRNRTRAVLVAVDARCHE
jgi:hypothetical protein